MEIELPHSHAYSTYERQLETDTEDKYKKLQELERHLEFLKIQEDFIKEDQKKLKR